MFLIRSENKKNAKWLLGKYPVLVHVWVGVALHSVLGTGAALHLPDTQYGLSG